MIVGMPGPRKVVAALAAAAALLSPWCATPVVAANAHDLACSSSTTGCLSCDLVAFFDFDCAGRAMFNNSAPTAVRGASATLVPWYVEWNSTNQSEHGSSASSSASRCTPNTVSGFPNTTDGAAAIKSGGGMKIDLTNDASLPAEIKNYTILLDVQAPPERALYALSESGWNGKPNPIVSLLHFGRNPHSKSALTWSRWSKYPFKFNANNARGQGWNAAAFASWEECRSGCAPSSCPSCLAASRPVLLDSR